MEEVKNTGYIEVAPRPTDYIAGVNSPIEYRVLNHFGAWDVFRPSFERQSGVYFDSMACVTFSALNCIEMNFRALLAYQMLPKEMIKELKDLGYYNDALEFNLSDRFTAKMSGTTRAAGALWRRGVTLRAT